MNKGKRLGVPRMARVPRAPRVIIDVSQETIDDSIKRNSSHCMIAEAVHRTLPYAINISVDLQTIRFTDKQRGLRYAYLTPRYAQIAIIQYDQGERPGPFRIILATAGASVRGAKVVSLQKGEEILTLEERLRVIEKLQAAKTARKVTFDQIGDDCDIAPRSIERYVSANPPVFSRIVASKLTAWSEGKPVLGKRPQAVPPSLVGGRRRVVSEPGHSTHIPSTVGGAGPPVGNIARRRVFGLKSMSL